MVVHQYMGSEVVYKLIESIIKSLYIVWYLMLFMLYMYYMVYMFSM
jgi:hypothetical protein